MRYFSGNIFFSEYVYLQYDTVAYYTVLSVSCCWLVKKKKTTLIITVAPLFIDDDNAICVCVRCTSGSKIYNNSVKRKETKKKKFTKNDFSFLYGF